MLENLWGCIMQRMFYMTRTTKRKPDALLKSRLEFKLNTFHELEITTQKSG